MEGNELAGLGMSLKKLHEGQKCKLPPGRGGCEAQPETSTASHKLFCHLRGRKETPRNLTLLWADIKDDCAGTHTIKAQEQKKIQLPRDTGKQDILIL